MLNLRELRESSGGCGAQPDAWQDALRPLPRAVLGAALFAVVLFCVPSCDSSPEEAAQTEVQLLTDGNALATTQSNLGYTVELTSARAVVRDFAFYSQGEVQTAQDVAQRPRPIFAWVKSILLPSAHAHPGHFQGGEVTGELTGRFVLDWALGATAPVGMGQFDRLL